MYRYLLIKLNDDGVERIRLYIESLSYVTGEYSNYKYNCCKRNNSVHGHALNDLNRKLLSLIASFRWPKISRTIYFIFDFKSCVEYPPTYIPVV